MVDLTMQKKIVAAATFKGMGDRRFPMFQLINAANQISYSELTGKLLQTDESGMAMQIGTPEKIAEQTESLNLAGQIGELVKAVNVLVDDSAVVNKRISVLENTTDEVVHQRLDKIESKKSKSV